MQQSRQDPGGPGVSEVEMNAGSIASRRVPLKITLHCRLQADNVHDLHRWRRVI